MDKFNLDVSLVARVGGHSAPRTYRDPHLCFDSDGFFFGGVSVRREKSKFCVLGEAWSQA